MRSRNIHAAAFALAGLMTLTPAFAWQNQGSTAAPQTRSQSGNQEQGALSPQDRKFVTEAAQGGMMEVELGRIASERAANADVKAFGRRMVEDHTAANEKLKQVAKERSLTLPTEMTAEQRQERDKLSRATGAEFDRMYVSHMVKDHEKDVSEFEKQTQKGDDAAVRSFAQQTLPTLREHLQLAHQLATTVGADHSAHSGH